LSAGLFSPIMAKTCDAEFCNIQRWSGGYCQLHQWMRRDEKYLKSQAKKKEKQKEKLLTAVPIRKVSKVQQKRDAEYSKNLPKWKEENPFCVFPDCNRPTDDCHHVIGRGIHTNNQNFMIPLCREHHDLCKDQPKLAEELKLIETRTISRKNLYD